MRHDINFAAIPLSFCRSDALAFTGLSEKLFDALERNGALAGRPIGRKGQKMYYREQLERVTANLFGAGASDIDDEFEGIGG